MELTVLDKARVVSCRVCAMSSSPELLRDTGENVPQPGWVGARYARMRVLLVGQNPAVPPAHLAAEDSRYTAALRAVRDAPSPETDQHLHQTLMNFVPSWPIRGQSFPLDECGLAEDDIAYFNVVRCRTKGNKLPGASMVSSCLATHFGAWLTLLRPKVVVFIGKRPFEWASARMRKEGIPHDFINRQRSLSSEERGANRRRVVELVRQSVGGRTAP